uniref:ABC transporter subunit C n=1 Tax=Jakoba libera TaxID=143017 RepID=M4QCA6_JAKLI|nr:ABC transporter subunit C [Jakoba libera]AGH24194.1 ABC transporter subunit C [Jakoba libera]
MTSLFTIKKQSQYQWFQPTLLLTTSQRLLFALAFSTLFLIISSLTLGFFFTQQDAQQGEHFKMIYLHVPFAWICMLSYLLLCISSFLYLISKHPIFFQVSKSFSITGSLFTFSCLITGSLWGFPTWGTFWVWDARLTSVLLLFFIYSIHLLLCYSTKESTSCFFALVGMINLPIIKYSVEWWSTLHQGASITQSTHSIHESIFIPMFLFWIALLLYSSLVLLIHLRSYILISRIHSLKSQRNLF